MYQVFFICNDKNLASPEEVLVFTDESDVAVVQFALSLHQAANVAHQIRVYKDEDDLSPIVDLIKCDK